MFVGSRMVSKNMIPHHKVVSIRVYDIESERQSWPGLKGQKSHMIMGRKNRNFFEVEKKLYGA